MPEDDQQVTRLLKEWAGGNKQALDQLMPLVYDQLRTLAARCLSAERPTYPARHRPRQRSLSAPRERGAQLQ